MHSLTKYVCPVLQEKLDVVKRGGVVDEEQLKPAVAANIVGGQQDVTFGPKAELRSGVLGNFEPAIKPGSGPGESERL